MNEEMDIAVEILPIHTCTQEELGVTERGENTRFYPIHEDSRNHTKFYSKKLKCFDSKLNIQGGYDSYKARTLKLTFATCNNDTIVPRDTCYSKDDITDFLRRKFIMVV